MIARMPGSPVHCRATALVGLLLAACSDPGNPVMPTLSADAERRLEQFADPSTWEALESDRPGSRLRDPRTGIVFRRIPKGEFDMGEDNRDAISRPRHRVALTRDYLLAETELTVGQWRRCVLEFAADPTVPVPEGDDDLPMTLSCHDAAKLAERFGYRLPTEAEWERACTGGVSRDDEPWATESGMDEYAWFHRNSNSQAQPVGTKAANPFGLFDMLGNVWEWCSEHFDPVAYAERGPLTKDPHVPAAHEHRVLRGGSWFSIPPASPRTRSSAAMHERTPFFGVRFARDVEPR